MPVSHGQVFDILSAVDVAQEPKSEQNASNVSSRLLDVEENEEDSSGTWKPNAPGKRCLKIALKDVNSDQIIIGIELTRIAWEYPPNSLVGKRVPNLQFHFS